MKRASPYYTFWGFDPVIPWLRDCAAWRECQTDAPSEQWSRDLWLLACYVASGREPKRVSIIASLLDAKARYG